jgi:hypothetical protein
MKIRPLLFCLLVFMLTITQKTIAQQELPSKIFKTSNWTAYIEQDGIQLFYKFEECNIPSEGFYREMVLLKLVNKNQEPKQVSWDIVLWYKDNCVNCDLSNIEQNRSITIAANSEMEATCALEEGQTLKMFSKFLNYKFDDWELTHFELRNFNIK